MQQPGISFSLIEITAGFLQNKANSEYIIVQHCFEVKKKLNSTTVQHYNGFGFFSDFFFFLCAVRNKVFLEGKEDKCIFKEKW